MKIKYPGIEVKDYEVFEHKENKDLLLKMLDDYDLGFSGLPVIFIGDRTFQSFGETAKADLETAIRRNIDENLIDFMPSNESKAITESKTITPINVPLLGKMDITNLSLPVVTVLLAVVDSFNPCAFFVLFFIFRAFDSCQVKKKDLTNWKYLCFLFRFIIFHVYSCLVKSFPSISAHKNYNTSCGSSFVIHCSNKYKGFLFL